MILNGLINGFVSSNRLKCRVSHIYNVLPKELKYSTTTPPISRNSKPLNDKKAPSSKETVNSTSPVEKRSRKSVKSKLESSATHDTNNNFKTSKSSSNSDSPTFSNNSITLDKKIVIRKKLTARIPAPYNPSDPKKFIIHPSSTLHTVPRTIPDFASNNPELLLRGYMEKDNFRGFYKLFQKTDFTTLSRRFKDDLNVWLFDQHAIFPHKCKEIASKLYQDQLTLEAARNIIAMHNETNDVLAALKDAKSKFTDVRDITTLYLTVFQSGHFKSQEALETLLKELQLITKSNVAILNAFFKPYLKIGSCSAMQFRDFVSHLSTNPHRLFSAEPQWIHDYFRGIRPNGRTCHILLSALFAQQSTVDYQAILEEMERVGIPIKPLHLNVCLAYAVKRGNTNQVQDLFSKFTSNPDIQPNPATLELYLQHYINLQRWDDVEEGLRMFHNQYEDMLQQGADDQIIGIGTGVYHVPFLTAMLEMDTKRLDRHLSEFKLGWIGFMFKILLVAKSGQLDKAKRLITQRKWPKRTEAIAWSYYCSLVPEDVEDVLKHVRQRNLFHSWPAEVDKIPLSKWMEGTVATTSRSAWPTTITLMDPKQNPLGIWATRQKRLGKFDVMDKIFTDLTKSGLFVGQTAAVVWLREMSKRMPERVMPTLKQLKKLGSIRLVRTRLAVYLNDDLFPKILNGMRLDNDYICLTKVLERKILGPKLSKTTILADVDKSLKMFMQQEDGLPLVPWMLAKDLPVETMERVKTSFVTCFLLLAKGYVIKGDVEGIQQLKMWSQCHPQGQKLPPNAKASFENMIKQTQIRRTGFGQRYDIKQVLESTKCAYEDATARETGVNQCLVAYMDTLHYAKQFKELDKVFEEALKNPRSTLDENVFISMVEALNRQQRFTDVLALVTTHNTFSDKMMIRVLTGFINAKRLDMIQKSIKASKRSDDVSSMTKAKELLQRLRDK